MISSELAIWQPISAQEWIHSLQLCAGRPRYARRLTWHLEAWYQRHQVNVCFEFSLIRFIIRTCRSCWRNSPICSCLRLSLYQVAMAFSGMFFISSGLHRFGFTKIWTCSFCCSNNLPKQDGSRRRIRAFQVERASTLRFSRAFSVWFLEVISWLQSLRHESE